jgi:chromate transport protein ChrA
MTQESSSQRKWLSDQHFLTYRELNLIPGPIALKCIITTGHGAMVEA